MTDNEIIKALSDAGDSVNYYGNIYLWDWERDVPIILKVSDVVSLINRQKAEIERLSNSAKQWEDTAKDLFVSRENDKAEAIKEFEDKIKDQFDRYGVDYTAYAIVDNVAKEVVGEDK